MPFENKVDATIASGGSLSSEINLSGSRVFAIQMPSSWTAASLTFQGSDKAGGTYNNIYDEEGNEVTAPVMDNRYHVNFWLGPHLVERGLWEQWALAWTANGQPGTPNHAEESVVFQGIELIDPQTVTSPANRML